MKEGAIKGLFKTALGLTLILGSFPAWSANRAQSPEIFFPNSSARGDIVVHQDDVVLRLPIMWSSSARINLPVKLTVEGKSADIAAGTLLPEVALADSTQAIKPLSIFCTPLKHAERELEHGVKQMLLGNGILWRSIAKHSSSGQFCLSDTRNAGQFDEIRYFSDSLPEGSTSVKIDSVPYTKLVNTFVSTSNEDEVRVTATHLGDHSLDLRLDIVQAGLARSFTSVSVGGFTASRTLVINLKKPMPQSAQIFGIDFDVVAADPMNKTVTIRFPAFAEQNRTIIIPEDTNFTYSFGY